MTAAFAKARGVDGLGAAASSLQAFVRGEDSDEAEVGALLVAEALLIFRKVHTKE